VGCPIDKCSGYAAFRVYPSRNHSISGAPYINDLRKAFSALAALSEETVSFIVQLDADTK